MEMYKLLYGDHVVVFHVKRLPWLISSSLIDSPSTCTSGDYRSKDYERTLLLRQISTILMRLCTNESLGLS